MFLMFAFPLLFLILCVALSWAADAIRFFVNWARRFFSPRRRPARRLAR